MSVSVDVGSSKIERLTGNCLVVLPRRLRKAPLRESGVTGGFESFTARQFFPGHVSLPAGKASQLFCGFHNAALRRAGRTTDEQKRIERPMDRRFDLPDHRICDGRRAFATTVGPEAMARMVRLWCSRTPL